MTPWVVEHLRAWVDALGDDYDSRTTSDIYDRFLRTRDRRQHAVASDTIMRGTPSMVTSQQAPIAVAAA